MGRGSRRNAEEVVRAMAPAPLRRRGAAAVSPKAGGVTGAAAVSLKAGFVVAVD